MGFFKGLFNKQQPPPAEPSISMVTPGDVCEVSLVTYQVIGRTSNPSRGNSMIILEDGTNIRYLFVENREQTTYSLYQAIDGRLDTLYEVPMTMELDDRTYHLQAQYTDYCTSLANTPFPSGNKSVWQFQSDDKKLLRIEWMNGRFELFEGEYILPADIEVMRGS